ncbi:N-acetyl-gamma-glutamyl-phosphate reductase [Taibaiella soli]|uniref:N-acetyl-gamma-glutamyl-phosphate reductase n=1 Tax=Taibaiella soli TaxID=1649169 RepID=A0A2W2C2B3_9BACT|nr:N-acetyl-gamma-glutamyl-phosphate reductase [Taibaiella soli]PZF74223.1 N-acetyl-gamma-glutamyl-phosphate reductase [Taibaiella soli]
MIKAGIIGGAGYTGGETLRILLRHPQVEIAFVHSKSQAGKAVHNTHTDLIGETEIVFTNELETNVDVLFLCVGHGEAKVFLAENNIPESVRIIDLSQDFRLNDANKHQTIPFVYGLPELQREQIKTAKRIANPGCFATAIQLGLLPLAANDILGAIYATGITGSTGAGQSLAASSHFSWRVNNISAYKTLTHQHMNEVKQSLQQASGHGSANQTINFIPWRGDFTRGIFVSLQMETSVSLDALQGMYESFYATHPFTTVSKESIHLKQVVNTNKCLIQLEKEGDQLAVHVTIDNLLKGASGQAVQNMNLMFGLEETAGLQFKASFF